MHVLACLIVIQASEVKNVVLLAGIIWKNLERNSVKNLSKLLKNHYLKWGFAAHLSSFWGQIGREINKYLFYLQVGFPPPPEVQFLTDLPTKTQREMSHQHSPSLKLVLMALRGIIVRILSTKEPKDKYSKIFAAKSVIERHVPPVSSFLASVPWPWHRLSVGHRQDPEHEASLEKPPEAW